MTDERSNTHAPEIICFQDYVGRLPHQWVLDNLIFGAVDKLRRIVTSTMVKEAVAEFIANTALTKRFKALPPEQRFRCAQVYLMGGGGLSLSEPTAYGKEPLLTSLLVFAAQNGQGGVRLFGFNEFEPILRPLMAEELFGLGNAGECFSTASASCPWRPLNDITAVCSLAVHGQLKRSVHGGLSRSALNALKRLVHDPTLTGKSIPDGASGGHPSGFLIGYCLKEALIVDSEFEYTLNRQKFSHWLDKDMKERLHKLSLYAEEFLEGSRLEFARELFGRAEGYWIAVDQLLPEADRHALIRVLAVFEFFGCLHTGHAHGGVRFAPCKLAGDDADKLYADEPKRDTIIMPDFSVLIPQEVSPAELFEFSNIGMLHAFDRVYKGYITKESVSKALSIGIEAALLRHWLLERRAAANVVKTVDEWIREFNRLYVSRGSVLASCDEKVTRQIAALEPLRKHLTVVEAHTVFMIRQGSECKVLDMLEKLGFDTRMPGRETEAVKHEGKAADLEPNRTAAVNEKRFMPLTDFNIAPETPPPPMNRTKYGSGLKALEISEIIHVVDYAILTNQSLVIDYEGSAYIKRDIYTVAPLGIDKGIDAAVEAEIPYVRGRKQFYLDKIKRIAVVAP